MTRALSMLLSVFGGQEGIDRYSRPRSQEIDHLDVGAERHAGVGGLAHPQLVVAALSAGAGASVEEDVDALIRPDGDEAPLAAGREP